MDKRSRKAEQGKAQEMRIGSPAQIRTGVTRFLFLRIQSLASIAQP